MNYNHQLLAAQRKSFGRKLEKAGACRRRDMSFSALLLYFVIIFLLLRVLMG
jgi:hypothetical protein